MAKKLVYEKIALVIFTLIFCIANVSYNVKATPTYASDGSWAMIYKDPMDSTKLKTDYDNNTYSDLISLIDHLVSNAKYNIYIKDGEYDLNGTLNIWHDGIVIMGESKENTKIIEKVSGQNSIKVNSNNFQIANCYIENTIGYVVFHAQNVDGAQLTNCIIKGSDGTPAVAIYGNETNMDIYTKIQGNTIYPASGSTSSCGQAIIVRKQKNADVSGNNVFGGSIDFEEDSDLTINNNSVKNSLRGGIRVTLPGENIKILNNITDNTKYSGIAVVVPSNNNRYSGIEVRNNTITNTGYFGIEINNLDHGIISDNQISSIDFYGIYLLRSDNLIVENNNILNCSLYNGTTPAWGTSSTVKASIYLELQVENSQIKNNVIHNDNAQVDQYGIRVQPRDPISNISNYNTGNTIINNSITGPFTKNVSAELADDSTNIMQVTAITENSIKLEWEEISPTTEYQIQVQDDGGNIVGEDPRDIGNNESYICTGLSSNALYKFKIRVKGTTSWSEAISATTSAISPPVLSYDSPTENIIKLNWNSVSGAIGYILEVDGSLISINSGININYTHTGLTSLTNHRYRIKAIGLGGSESGWSSEIQVKTAQMPSPTVSTTTSSESNTTTAQASEIKPNNPTNFNSSSSRSRSKSNMDRVVEFSLENNKTLEYKENFINDKEENRLRRMLLYTFKQQYCFNFRVIEDNKIITNYQFRINLVPENLFKENEISHMLINKNEKIDTIIVRDYANYGDDVNKNNLLEYSLGDEYSLSIENSGVHIQKSEKRIQSIN